MDIPSITWQLIYLWGGIYTIVFIAKYVLRYSVPTRGQMVASLLPSHIVNAEHDNGTREQTHVITKVDGDQLQDELHINLFRIRFTTWRLKSMFDRLTKLCPTFWHCWFSLGVIVGGIVLVVDILVLVGVAFKALTLLGSLAYASVSETNDDDNDQQLQQWAKRDIGYNKDMKQQIEHAFLSMILELVGPLAHIGYYISALLICGVIHEVGHATATFLEQIPMQNCGVFFYYIYPGAFVNLSGQYLLALAPFRQLKIMCAGTFHNVILYGFTLCMLGGGLKSLLERSGWQSLEGNGGVSIVQVSHQSLMVSYLPVSSIIYQLDDTELEQNKVDWDKFLLNPHGREPPHPGFCAVVDETSPTTLACCEIDDQYPFGKALNASFSCFRKFDSTLEEKVPDGLRCLPTIQVLGPRHPERCENDDECSSSSMRCVTPYTPSKNGQVVRIYARMPSWMNLPGDQDKVFVFEGELLDMWESVKVDILQPKYWFLPATLPHRVELWLRYTSTFTLALAMLNMLPAFKLDGDYAALKFLFLIFQRTLNITRTHGILVNFISYLVSFIIIAGIVLGIFL